LTLKVKISYFIKLMKKILAEISIGELADKLTILEIKLKKIGNKDSLENINKEYQSLKSIDLKGIDQKKYQPLFNELKSINEKLWDIENEKRLFEKNSNFGDKFIKVSRDVHFMNDKRAKVKQEINKTFGSNIEEVKEYTKY
tara:strand:- start:257 stop:682 length:426 start_codon:yes stop_codon:yes gene_type:complete